jgi:Zn-dependent alcohol dehydrogenase
MKSKAAILFSKKKVKIIDVEIPLPKENQILVKNLYSSICHTQLGEYLMKRGEDKYLPHCLGHEGVAKVISVGSNVKKIKRNDHVVMSWIKGDGHENGGTKYFSKKFGEINAGPVNTFSNYSLVSENRVYKIKKINNLKKLTLMGCAIPTAFNAVFDSLKVKKNSTMIIAGMGGLGIACLYASIYSGCKKIICIDINKKKLSNIEKLKNVEIICNKKVDISTLLKKQIKKADYTIDCTGNLGIVEELLSATKFLGGKCLIIGNPEPQKKISLDPWQFILGKSILGAWNSNKSFEKKFYKFLDIFLKSDIDRYFSGQIYKLNEINKAFNDLKSGKVLRPTIKF